MACQVIVPPEKMKEITFFSETMTPEQEQALNAHLEAIAEILCDESDPAAMTTLEGIELTVREKIQAHVSPELGIFLSAKLAARHQASRDNSKVPLES